MGQAAYFLTHDAEECEWAHKRLPPSHRFAMAGEDDFSTGKVNITMDMGSADALFEDILLLEETSRGLHVDNDRLLAEAIGLANDLRTTRAVALARHRG